MVRADFFKYTQRDIEHLTNAKLFDAFAGTRMMLSAWVSKTPKELIPLWVDSLGEQNRQELIEWAKNQKWVQNILQNGR